MNQPQDFLKETIENRPSDWVRLTTHRLDIYKEEKAKVEFLEEFEKLYINFCKSGGKSCLESELALLPTAFDYIRLGHPLSCVLEWALAKESGLPSENVISFSSQAMPILAVLRKNKFLKKKTRILIEGVLPRCFDARILKDIYEYDFEIVEKKNFNENEAFDGSTIDVNGESTDQHEFVLRVRSGLGSVMLVSEKAKEYIGEIQHVRRRESIAMTPQNCLSVLKQMIGESEPEKSSPDRQPLEKTIQNITQANSSVALGTSGLSIQYAIMMGLVHHAKEHYAGREIKFIVPPNCYGGTNDQARRVAACIENVEVIDLPVDSGKDMVKELDRILGEVANQDAVPYIIAEIPTNPRVEIPDLEKLRETLKIRRKTSDGGDATGPVFILDQTFCPNVIFFGDSGYLHDVSTISYVSGSKFPSGGLCTAGYCVANLEASQYMSLIEKHLKLCDNEATDLQIEILKEEMPSMVERIAGAYQNTRDFVDYIRECLPEAKINFVSKELADASFTPSVFSLDLPTKGETHEQRESNKQELNHRLIQMMIEAIPDESKHCVSYGQLKGCYWTIPATSTQGTTKESDKDYIVRVSVAADFDLEKHKAVFKDFCSTL